MILTIDYSGQVEAAVSTTFQKAFLAFTDIVFAYTGHIGKSIISYQRAYRMETL